MQMVTFFKVNNKEVRQLGELPKDSGAVWQSDYDLTYMIRECKTY